MNSNFKSQVCQIENILIGIFSLCANDTQEKADQIYKELSDVYDLLNRINDVYKTRKLWNKTETEEKNKESLELRIREQEIYGFTVLYKPSNDNSLRCINYPALIERLRNLRMEREISQVGLAKEMNSASKVKKINSVSKSLRRFEKGYVIPSIIRFMDILCALNCDLSIVEKASSDQFSIEAQICMIKRTLTDVYAICANGTQIQVEMAYEQLENIYALLDKIYYVHKVRKAWRQNENVKESDLLELENMKTLLHQVQDHKRQDFPISSSVKTLFDINSCRDDYSELVRKLGTLRVMRGIDRMNLANSMNVTTKTVIRIEKEQTILPLTRFTAILHSLNCELMIVEKNGTGMK